MLIINVFILIALIKILLETDRYLLCAGIYVGSRSFFSLVAGHPLPNVILAGAIGFALATLFFWLLYKSQDSALFWLFAIVGLLIGLV